MGTKIMTRYWVGVASHEHVKAGVTGGFAQVCHGKCSPLKKMNPGDWIVYYSPVEIFESNIACRKFTAMGKVDNREPYEVSMYEDFTPWRRDVAFVPVTPVAIHALLHILSFITNKVHWGMIFRRGCFEIPKHDFQQIADAMGVTIDD